MYNPMGLHKKILAGDRGYLLINRAKVRLFVCLSVRHRLAQFLTDRARSGTNRFRILPGMSQTKKILKRV